MDYFDEIEMERERDTPLATPDDACREYALNVGRENPDRAWIATPYDTWQPNPFYEGPPVPHPNDDSWQYDDEPAPAREARDEDEDLWF